MRTFYLVCSLCLGLAPYASAWTASFNIIGNSTVSEETIRDIAGQVACSELDSICVDAICRAIAGHYWEQGYLDAEVACRRPNPRADTVWVSISEGARSRLKSVRVSGASIRDSTTLEAIFTDQLGKPFSRSSLERGITEVLSFYDARGYPFTSVRPDLLSRGGGWVGVGLAVDEGPRARLGDVVFRGLSRTKAKVALLETGLASGAAYDGGKIESARGRLLALGIFDEVSEAELTFDGADTTVSVAFDIIEARANLFEGMIAYAPSAEANRFVGLLYLEMRNIGGTLRRLRVLWNKPGTDRLNWSIDYREPRILGRPFAVEAGIFSDVIEASFARRKFELGITFRGEPRFELGIGGFLGVTKDRSLEGGEGDFSERGGSFDFRYEGRDNPINPRSGQSASVSSEVASLDFEEESSVDRTVSGLDVHGEFLADLRYVTAGLGGRFRGAFASEGDVPASHLIRLGGMRSLRGYPEEWFVVELRRLMGRHSRIYVFADAATLEDDTRDFADLAELPFGYGVGLMGGSRSGIFRLEIALGRHDIFSDAKLHLGLVQRF
jgi:outer membrane protein assembly factor BamA